MFLRNKGWIVFFFGDNVVFRRFLVLKFYFSFLRFFLVLCFVVERKDRKSRFYEFFGRE